MVNPDGALRLDRLGEGRTDTGVRMDAAQVERIIRLVASHARAEVHGDAPIVSAELPPHIEGRAGERFEGVLPPVSTAPCFSIRKPAERLYSLDDYVADGIMAQAAADRLKACVTQRYNILVAGGTSSGKTTLANAQQPTPNTNPNVTLANCSSFSSAACYSIDPSKTWVFDGSGARLANFGSRVGNVGANRVYNIGGDGSNPAEFSADTRLPLSESQRYQVGANFK
ncbi:hypothetical protein LTR94_030075, partial [Friedmanniomyces endolithicus]